MRKAKLAWGLGSPALLALGIAATVAISCSSGASKDASTSGKPVFEPINPTAPVFAQAVSADGGTFSVDALAGVVGEPSKLAIWPVTAQDMLLEKPMTLDGISMRRAFAVDLLGPENQVIEQPRFTSSIGITAGYTEQDLAQARGDPSLLTLLWFNNTDWRWEILHADRDSASRTLRANADHPSVFGIGIWKGEGALPTPTSVTSPDFATFNDGSNLFSIAYPSEWDLEPSLMPGLEEWSKSILRSKRTGLDLSESGFIFLAGEYHPEGGNYLPNVNIIIESLSSGISATEWIEGQQETLRGFTGYSVHSTTKTLVSNRDVLIQDWEADASAFDSSAKGKTRFIQLFAFDGKVGWVVTCTVSIGTAVPAEDLQTCNAVVRNFRILQ